jgi:NAD(P)H-nitrite reductase large subunit
MKHVVVGAGPSGLIATENLRALDPGAKITLIMDEDAPPYSRMAIPYYLADQIKEGGTHLRKAKSYCEDLDIDYRQNTRVEKIDAKNKELTLSAGKALKYDKLLLAVGSRALVPPVPGIDAGEGIYNCWTLDDSRNIIKHAKPGSKVLLMGAGFIGCIILEALVKRNVELTVVEMEDRMVPRMMDKAGGGMIKKWCESKGIKVLTSTKVMAIEAGSGGHRFKVAFDKGKAADADLVITATGVKATTDFLKGSGVKHDFGIMVNNHLQTNVADIYASGDCAQGLDFSDGSWTVQAIQPTAVEHGRIAAQNMVGISAEHRGSLNMNVLATLGLITSSYGMWMGVEGGDHAEIIDKDRFRYMRLEFLDDKIVGALSLGLTQHVGVLRGLIQTEAPLGGWKKKLKEDPLRIMEAYLARVHLAGPA